MIDFTLHTYHSLLLALRDAGYAFLPMAEFVAHQGEHVVCLRHDVDLRAANSLRTAQLEHSLGIRATYYFRVVPESDQPDIIRAIAALGHEIGYHYEDMSLFDGRIPEAYAHFQDRLAYFRTYYPVRTICMHGAPTSRYDGRDLWNHHSYRDLGIICEPYLDIDYSRVLYLTDTGRCWDGFHVSVRDKIPVFQDQWTRRRLTFHSTPDLVAALRTPASPLRQAAASDLPSLLITTHPQRWTNHPLPWIRELLLQSLKNVVKRLLILLQK